MKGTTRNCNGTQSFFSNIMIVTMSLIIASSDSLVILPSHTFCIRKTQTIYRF